MARLMDTLLQSITPALAAQLADLLGEAPEAVTRGLHAALPTLLAAAAIRAGHEGMPDVMRAETAGLEGGNALHDLAATLADPAARGALMAHGDAMNDALLADQRGPIAGALAAETGLQPGSVDSLLRIGAPMVAGAIAQVPGGRPAAQDIADRLDAERPAIFAALPPGMEARLLPLAAAASPLHGTPVEGAAAAATTSARWLPWLVAAVAAIALIAGLRSCRTEQAKLAAAPVATTPIVTEAPVVLETVSLPDGTVLELQPGAVGLELARFLAGAEPAPRAFRFEAFGYGSAEDRLDGEGEAAVRAVASIMRAWPTVEARIIGHTDDQGEAAANAALSARRASMVEAAIEAAGIAADRIESEGRGEEEPIATNETAEGRAQNRRTIILVIRK